MTTTNRYFVKVTTVANNVKEVIVYGNNEKTAKEWALRHNGVTKVISVFCDGPIGNDDDDDQY